MAEEAGATKNHVRNKRKETSDQEMINGAETMSQPVDGWGAGRQGGGEAGWIPLVTSRHLY